MNCLTVSLKLTFLTVFWSTALPIQAKVINLGNTVVTSVGQLTEPDYISTRSLSGYDTLSGPFGSGIVTDLEYSGAIDAGDTISYTFSAQEGFRFQLTPGYDFITATIDLGEGFELSDNSTTISFNDVQGGTIGADSLPGSAFAVGSDRIFLIRNFSGQPSEVITFESVTLNLTLDNAFTLDPLTVSDLNYAIFETVVYSEDTTQYLDLVAIPEPNVSILFGVAGLLVGRLRRRH